jgi:glycosyltransferase involved in cell wall biosynthesis
LFDLCLRKSSLILPISKYLENEVRKRYPEKNIKLFPADGRDPEEWFPITVQKLKHPCVGLLQGLNIWGKSKELLTLKNVLKELPQVTFYLAGDGIYRNEIIPQLENFENFVWLKNLKYPEEVKEFFSEIDIFLLLSGLEGLGQTIIEALLMKKPTIASNTGGVPELIADNKTGVLVETGDDQMVVEKIHKLINESDFANQIAETGYEFVKKEFSWEEIAKKFKDIIKTDLVERNIE